MLRKGKFAPAFALLAALALAPMAHAETLADRVPADALVYSQWAGSDTLGAAYDQSNLKGLIDTLNLPQLITDAMQKHQAQETDPAKAADQQVVHDLLPLLLKSQTGLYVGPFDMTTPDNPQVKIAIFSKIGADNAAKYAPSLTDIIQRKQAANPDKKHPPVVAVAAGDYLVINIGEGVDMDKRLAGAAPADGLSTTDAYKAAIAQVHATDSSAAIMYMNGDALLKSVDNAIASNAQPRFAQMWPLVADAMGLNAITSAAWTGNFDGKDWHGEAFVGLRQRRVGFAAFLDYANLSDDTLKLIPKNAAWAGVTRFDGSRLINDVRAGFTAAGPGPAKSFERGLQAFFAYTGVDVEKDLFASLGDAYVYYGTPDENGKTLENFTFVNTLKDPAKGEAAFSSLEAAVSAMVQQRMPNIQFATQPLAAPFDKVTAHVITTPILSPAWAVSDGKLYVCGSTKTLQASVSASKDSSILDNPTFAAALAKMPQKSFAAFDYNDQVTNAPEIYSVISGILDRYKADHPDFTFTLPPVDQITAHLSPSLLTAWTDADGCHFVANGPFPFSAGIGPKNFIQYDLMLKAAVRRAQPAPAMP